VPDTSRYKNTDNDQRGPYILSDVTAPFCRPSLRFDWHGKLPPLGRSWRYSKRRTQALEAEGRIVFSDSKLPKLKRYLSEAIRPDTQIVEPVLIFKVESIVRVAMRSIALSIAENPSCLAHVEWRDLERVLREVFECLGFTTKLTRSGKDGGFDLQLECVKAGKALIFLVEVKHWLGSGKKAGQPVLKALIDIVARSVNGTTGLLLSSSGFTTDVINSRTEVEQHRVRLGGHSKIVSLCQHYLQSSKSGLWIPTSDLPDLLLHGTN